MRPDIADRQRVAAATVGKIVSENPFLVGIRDQLLRMIPEKAAYKAKKIADFGITHGA
jgi:hypothetical protein